MTDEVESKAHHREFDKKATTAAIRGNRNVSRSPNITDEVQSKMHYREFGKRETTSATPGNRDV